MALSQTRANKIKKPGRYGDGRNLYLRVTETGNRSWILRYELRSRERVMGLGPCADFTLEEARERARVARQLLKDGSSPRSGLSCHASLCSSEVGPMSAFGPKRTCVSALQMSAIAGKADISFCGANVCF